MWVIYSLYVPTLLIKYGFSKEFTTILLIFENFLEAAIEPIFGSLSDKQQKDFGTRLPIIILGVMLSSIMFLAIPTFFTFGRIELRWFLPGLILAWAYGMGMFRSPVMSLIGRCAPKPKLPLVASIITLTSQVIGTLKFDAGGYLLKIGPMFAFGLGSFCLLMAAMAFRFTHVREIPNPEQKKKKSKSVSWLIIQFTVVLGMAIALGLKLLNPILTHVVILEFGANYSKWAMTGFFILVALFSLPIAKIASKTGNSQTILIGAIATIICLPCLLYLPPSIYLLITLTVLAVSLSAIFNGVIPFVLSIVSSQKAGFATGLYFAGFLVGNGIFDCLSLGLIKITPIIGAIGGGIAFLIVALAIDNLRRHFNREFFV